MDNLILNNGMTADCNAPDCMVGVTLPCAGEKKSAPVRCLSSKFFDQLFSVITAMRVVGAVCLGMPPSHVVTGPNVSVHSAVH